jgi:pyruvate dehydrogenase E1 component alpha subunit
MIAELYCRETGCSKGRGGSMHLLDTSVGHIGSSSIVGGCIPIGVGLGLAIKMQKEDRISVAFFGDGAADRGVLYESVNFAALKRLPVVFVYENNQYSVCSPVSARQAGEVLFHGMSPELIQSFMVDGNSVVAVYEASREAVGRARAGKGPSFIECKTYRVRGHAGSGPDTALGYRTAEEITAWEARCPVTRFRDKILADGTITEESIRQMEQEIEAEIDEAFCLARKGPLPREEDLALYLFRE